MRCPNDGSRLVEVERADVLIDACPTCRGVWLDRGELDKILVKERSIGHGDPDEDFFREVQGSRPDRPAPRTEPRQDQRDDDRRRDEKYCKKKKRKSLLEELLDF